MSDVVEEWDDVEGFAAAARARDPPAALSIVAARGGPARADAGGDTPLHYAAAWGAASICAAMTAAAPPYTYSM
eukprot:gene5509-8386_t